MRCSRYSRSIAQLWIVDCFHELFDSLAGEQRINSKESELTLTAPRRRSWTLTPLTSIITSVAIDFTLYY